VKWYDDYEDVKAIRHLIKLTEAFGEEQDMTYAWKELNVGEDGAIHEGDNHSPRGELVTDQATELEEFCDDMLMVSHPEIQFGTDYSGNMDTIREIPNGEKEEVNG